MNRNWQEKLRLQVTEDCSQMRNLARWVLSSTVFCKHICSLLLLLSRVSRVRLCDPVDRQPTRLPRPWDSPGQNTGVGCHFLLQCMKVKSESEVAQSCPTLSDPMDCSPPGSSIHGICQARVLEWTIYIAVSIICQTETFVFVLHTIRERWNTK